MTGSTITGEVVAEVVRFYKEIYGFPPTTRDVAVRLRTAEKPYGIARKTALRYLLMLEASGVLRRIGVRGTGGSIVWDVNDSG